MKTRKSQHGETEGTPPVYSLRLSPRLSDALSEAAAGACVDLSTFLRIGATLLAARLAEGDEVEGLRIASEPIREYVRAALALARADTAPMAREESEP